MIDIYCRSNLKDNSERDRYQLLLEYAYDRLDRCPFGDHKGTCRKCPIHCYKPEMRERMKQVMRFAGPRMILYHPIAAIRHFVHEHTKPTPLP